MTLSRRMVGEHGLVPEVLQTQITRLDPTRIGRLIVNESAPLDDWELKLSVTEDAKVLQDAARLLGSTDSPMGFPTETVYGLGANATRREAVRNIYRVKGRPPDNPLIVHFSSLNQLRKILRPESNEQPDPIPDIYKPLIQRFWPGPLTLIMPLPKPSPFAEEVTAGLPTFGARMPRSLLALALIRLANCPVAAPSANASTKPSPTIAEHVYEDLNGRISLIIDGGPCEVGLESTVVDGLCSPPAILRPGGISIEELRQCPGWGDVQIGYKNNAESGGGGPRAPGMKYRHYSPRAKVILYETGSQPPDAEAVVRAGGQRKSVGFIRTKLWPSCCGLNTEEENGLGKLRDGGGVSPNRKQQTLQMSSEAVVETIRFTSGEATNNNLSLLLDSVKAHAIPLVEHYRPASLESMDIWQISLGPSTQDVARGLFAALRELDRKEVEAIFVEGLADNAFNNDEPSLAAAIMNRLRKASETTM